MIYGSRLPDHECHQSTYASCTEKESPFRSTSSLASQQTAILDLEQSSGAEILVGIATMTGH